MMIVLLLTALIFSTDVCTPYNYCIILIVYLHDSGLFTL